VVPNSIATTLGWSTRSRISEGQARGGEAGATLAAFKKDLRIGDVVLTAWNDLAEVIEAHTGKFGDTAYRIRFLTQPPLCQYPEDWVPSRWITVRLLSLETVRRFFETALDLGGVKEELGQMGGELLARRDSELLEWAKGAAVELHKAGALIPMLLQAGVLKKNHTPD